jgi:hypothetical protein
MRNEHRPTEAGRQYEAAHAAHYTAKDLRHALEIYTDITAAHPETREAEYSRGQIDNIVKSVVSKQEFLDAQVKLAFAHLEKPPTA